MQKRPRDYAADIVALRTVEQRRTALAGVPEVFRAWVAVYVQDYFDKKRLRKR